MKAFFLISSVLLFLQSTLRAQTLDTSDQRRIEQRRVFATGFYREPRGSSAYCNSAGELAFICASEGKKDSAFYFLNETFSYTGKNERELNSIYDPYNLGNYPFLKWKNEPEWKAYEHTVTEKYMAMHTGLKQVRLSLDLLKAFGLDQSIRVYCMKIRKDAHAKAEGRKIDSTNLVFIKQVVKKYGFPSLSMVGENAYEGAFILCQHADDDIAFQKAILVQLKKLAASGDAKKEDVAYLTDRIMVKERGTQVYGTQFKNYVLYPIIDSTNVDRRRAEMGLGTLAEYLKGMSGDITPPGRN